MNMKSERVIIVDDEAIIRNGLREWLSREYETICFDNGESFLDAFYELETNLEKPTCILLDFQMPGLNGVEIQGRIRELNSRFPIIFISGNAQNTDIINAWRGGAVDFILKPFSASQISEVIEAQFAQLKKQSNNAHIAIDSKVITDIPITRREAQVLELLGKGCQQNDIARELNISIRTVKMYRSFLKNKLNLNTIADVIRYYDQYKYSIACIANGVI